MVDPSFSKRDAAETTCRSPTSAGRLRVSSKRLNDAISHCCTLPFRCRIKLPMLLLASFGRHQTCSSFSDSRQPRNRGQYCLSSFSRENSRKRLEMSWSVIAYERLLEGS